MYMADTPILCDYLHIQKAGRCTFNRIFSEYIKLIITIPHFPLIKVHLKTLGAQGNIQSPIWKLV